MEQAWKITWDRFYLPMTHLFYDYLTSYEPGKGLAHLPSADEVRRQYPNLCGYGTGMEDCMISAGVMLSLIADRFAVTNDDALCGRARLVLDGMHLCATAHGVPGFLARAVCAEDLRSIYITSSRDQYTHAVHGLWHYSKSPLADKEERDAIATIVSSVADRMYRNVIPGNDYDSLCADGSRDERGISRLWNVTGHEAARLPMIYAAAWDITGKGEYQELWRKYAGEAVRQSMEFDRGQPTYALLQMQCSLELLEPLETDPSLKKQMRGIMAELSANCAVRARNADQAAGGLDLAAPCSDWRTGEGLDIKGQYRRAWYNIRESGEAFLCQLMDTETPFPDEQKILLARAISRLDYNRVSSNGIFYLQAAYWKARRRGSIAADR